jgi:hypothetical protein
MTLFNMIIIHPSIHLPMHLQMAGRREVNRKKRMTLFIMINHPSHTHTHTKYDIRA